MTDRLEAIPVRVVERVRVGHGKTIALFVQRTEDLNKYWAVRENSMPYFTEPDREFLFKTREEAEVALAVARLTGSRPSREDLGFEPWPPMPGQT